jgi:hypothetical protein
MKRKQTVTFYIASCLLAASVMPVVAQDEAEPPAHSLSPAEQVVKSHVVTRIRTMDDPMLSAVEKDDREFLRTENALINVVSFFHERKIGEAIVENDYIRYMFDSRSGDKIEEVKKWRQGLPDKLPQVISQAEAEAQAAGAGTVQSSRLMYIAPNSEIFHFDPVPSNPCWVVTTRSDEQMTITVIDAVTGKPVGKGTPPPYEGLSIHGPDWDPCDNAAPLWLAHAQNAETWFETMGYDTQRIGSATAAQISGHIQSDSTAMFYELDHGGATSFHNRCEDDTTAVEVETWITNYSSMPFAFIGSCGGMTSTGEDTFATEFRKGLPDDTVVVGYNGMSDAVCENDCWGEAIAWQTELFSRMNSGNTVGQAYAFANAAHPNCTDDGRTCMLMAGDTNLKFAGDGVPEVKRSFGGPIYNVSGVSPFPGTSSRTYTRAYHIRYNAYVPAGSYYLTLVPIAGAAYVELVFLNNATFTVNGSYLHADATNGEVRFVSEENRSNGMKLTYGQDGELMVYINGQIKIY